MTDNLAKLRVPFEAHQISYLPKGGVKLAYVGHAALTDRLLETDPLWQWEPMALNPQGLPALDECGGMWIRLTVCGVTRLGYGHAGNKEGGDAIKERIGDALRNAAMRFGAALDLWHKGDLHDAKAKESASAVFAGRLAEAISLGDPLSAATAFYEQADDFKKSVWACLGTADKKAITAHKTELETA